MNGNGPCAIIDIGSNSVRLVIFRALSRVPAEMLTEQIYPHLGRDIARTGRLDPVGKRLCIDGLRRYAMLCEAYGVADRIVVATAAIREASDGAGFVAAIRAATGLEVEVLSGVEEGRLSALGVLSGIPHADGIVGDIGGGSLELACVSGGSVGERTTLPLGPFRLQRAGDSRSRRDELIRLIDSKLQTVPWVDQARGKSFYAVGGNWRAIAKAQIRRDQHPLDIVHQHELPLRESLEIAGFLSTLSQASLERFSVSRKRTKLVPYAALVMERVLRAARPRSLVFSGFGLREGIVFDRLANREKQLDPLLEACRLACEDSDMGEALSSWTDRLFEDERQGEARLRHAVCLLADSGRGDNPVHRAQSAYERAMYLRGGDLDHEARAFMAYALYVRYGGSPDSKPGKSAAETVSRLATAAALRHAFRLGKILAFAEGLCGGSAVLLRHFALQITDTRIMLDQKLAANPLMSEPMLASFQSLAKDLHLTPVLRQTGPDLERSAS